MNLQETYITVSIEARLVDARALKRAAVSTVLQRGEAVNLRDALEFVLDSDGVFDAGRALRLIVDPGASPDGVEIQDSSSEVFSA